MLASLAPKGVYAEIHPEDAAGLGIAPGGMLRIVSRRASLLAKARSTPTIRRGQVFLPMHYAETNLLTHASFDPHSRQPNYKACAVRVEKARRRTS